MNIRGFAVVSVVVSAMALGGCSSAPEGPTASGAKRTGNAQSLTIRGKTKATPGRTVVARKLAKKGAKSTPITTTVTAGVGAADAGAASGLMNTTKQFGAALGLAVLVTASAGDLATPQALAAEHGRAFLMIAAVLVVVAAVATALPAPSRDQAGQRPT